MQDNLTIRTAFEAWYIADANAQLGSTALTPEKMVALREGCGYGINRNMLNGKWLSWQAAHEAGQPAQDDASSGQDAYSFTGTLVQIVDKKVAEIERLTACLKTANANAEKFEREWYLRGDEIEALRKDVERLDLLDRQGEAYGTHEHEGNRWLIEGPFKSLRAAIDGAIANSR